MRKASVVVLVLMSACATADHGPQQYSADFQAPVRSSENLDADSKLCRGLLVRGDYDGAVRECRQAVSLNPDDANVHATLGMVLDKKGDYNGAIQEYRQAVSLDPNIVPLHDSLCRVLQAKGDYDGAIRECRKAISLYSQAPATPNVLAALPHEGLGNALRAKGDYDGAIHEYRLAIDLYPNNNAAHRLLASALQAKGDLGGANQEYRLAEAIAAPNGPAFNSSSSVSITSSANGGWQQHIGPSASGVGTVNTLQFFSPSGSVSSSISSQYTPEGSLRARQVRGSLHRHALE